ncbi:eotaxin-like [Lates japonicus]|uniref:C-C motif chemokine n=1 Tax=Lates japonicus TaxID=270547 RepID=A0AAD3RKS1_LATJO|nr:eotaxin-like protein [Lates japonicus]GLD72187.1 eotaxin-like protein [Lates japonicus]
MVSTASAQGGLASCCLTISSTQIHRNMLKSYYIQSQPSCQLHAVVFTTLRDRRICSDPKGIWTQTSMAFIDGKNWQLRRTSTHQRHH